MNRQSDGAFPTATVYRLLVRHGRRKIAQDKRYPRTHTAKRLRVPDNMRILYLPPYSPKLNPVEYLRDDIREKDFSNRVFADTTALEDHLMNSLARMEEDLKRV